MEKLRYGGRKSKKPTKKEQLNNFIGHLKGMSWVLWAFLLAAAVNFFVALFQGSLLSLVACILILTGLAGSVKCID
jgi:type IV secretory pathway TrbL component